MDYSKLTKEELIELLSGREESSGKYGLVWDREKELEKVVQDCDKNIPIISSTKKSINKNEEVDHIIIEGDNFHSLSVLNYTHNASVDLIYIDPPYNTGKKDFIYNDSFVNEDDGYKHSKWLNFMEKRLQLAKNLLKEDGVIFISIDEHEFAQLKLLCDGVFNSKNYVGEFIRKTKSSTNDADSFFNQQHDYCLIYKNNDFSFYGVSKDLSSYKNPDNDPNGNWKSSDPSAKSGGESTYFEIKNPITGQIDLPPKGRYWAFSKKSLEEYIKIGKIKFKDKIKKNERGFIFKTYQNTLKNVNKPIDSLYFDNNKYMNQVATKEINDLDIEFDYPKPVDFIKDIIRAVGKESAVILDFFAGTGTTGQAVIELNKEDGGHRQVILCTDNENDICENATYKRMKKCINGNANLKYYKCNFVKNNNNKDQLYFDLTEKCIPMICIKDNNYNEYIIKEDYMIYSNKDKTSFTCIYYSLFGENEDEFISNLEKIDGKKHIYKFSLNNHIDMSDYNNVKDWINEPIPSKIVEIYKKLVKISKMEK